MPLDKTTQNFNDSVFLAEYIRHLNTLSTSSILLITIFLEKLFLQPKWKPLVGVALVSFLVSLISGVVVYTAAATDPTAEPHNELVSVVLGTVIVAMWAGFLIGVLSIAVFALKNL